MQDPFPDVCSLARREGICPCAEKVEGGEDEECPGHARGVGAGVFCGKESSKTSLPVLDMPLFFKFWFLHIGNQAGFEESLAN